MSQRIRARGMLVGAVLLGAVAFAAEPIPAEVSERFARGLRLFAAGNAQAAATEFEYVRARLPRPSVTYNLALVYAELGQPAESVAMAEAVLAEPGALTAERLAKLTAVREAQLQKLGELVIHSDVPGVEVQIGGKVVGHTPFDAPVRVPTGRAFVGGQAPKRKPAFAEAQVTSQRKVEVTLQLAPLEQQLGSVRLQTSLPGADVLVDGVLVGQTPGLQRVPVEPGQHTLSLRREGYATASQVVTVGEGAEVELPLAPKEDAAALATSGAQVTLQASEDQVVVSVDGVRRGAWLAPLKLAPGPHLLLIERGGFYPVQQRLTLLPTQELTLPITFEPTAELRAELSAGRSRNHVLGVIGMGAGVALAGGMVAVLQVNIAARRSFQAQADQYSRQNLDGTCAAQKLDCVATIDELNRKIAGTGVGDGLAWTGLGVGVAAAVAGLVVYLAAPDPSRYDRPANESLVPLIGLVPTSGGGLLAASGRF